VRSTRYLRGGLPTRVLDGDGDAIVASVEHDATGRITEIRHGNGVTTAHSYDADALLAATMTRSPDGAVLQDVGYGYDAVGNVTAIVDHAFGRSQRFEYDELNRLANAAGAYGEEIYRYDGLGNLLRRGNLLMAIDADRRQRVTCGIDLGLLDSPANGIANNPHLATCAGVLVAPGNGHRPEDRAAVGVIRARGIEHNEHIGQSFALDYDAVGNVIGKSGQTYVYDAENRLLRILEPNGQLTEDELHELIDSLVPAKAAE